MCLSAWRETHRDELDHGYSTLTSKEQKVCTHLDSCIVRFELYAIANSEHSYPVYLDSHVRIGRQKKLFAMFHLMRIIAS